MIPALIGGGAALIGGGLVAYSAAMARRFEAAVPQDGEVIPVGDDRIHVVDKGSGPPIVMIHGLGGQMRNFARAMSDELARDHRVVLVDRPGSGYSVRGSGVSARLRTQADTIADLIAKLGIEKPLIVGHSLGGALALAVAIHRPEAVSALALIAPLTQVQTIDEMPEVFKPLVIRSPAVRRAVSWTVATPMGVARGEKALVQVFAPEPVPEDFGTEGGGLLAMRPNNFYATSSDVVALEGELETMVPHYPALRIPVGILYGRGDALLDYRKHGERTAAEIPGAEIEVVGGGHMLPFTQPDKSAQFVRAAAARKGESDGGARAAG